MKAQIVISDLVSYILREIDRNPAAAPQFDRLPSAKEIWGSLVFCILSSQVRVAMADRSARALLEDVRFFQDSPSHVDIYNGARATLRRDDVRYRFPEVKAKQIAKAWIAFAPISNGFYGYLDSFANEKEARAEVARQFPGLGLKQASMFLRDIGYSDRLCVVDTHILWYARLRSPGAEHLTEKRYLEVERFLLAESDEYGVAPNVFDTAIWAAVKTFKSTRCMTQFA